MRFVRILDLVDSFLWGPGVRLPLPAADDRRAPEAREADGAAAALEERGERLALERAVHDHRQEELRVAAGLAKARVGEALAHLFVPEERPVPRVPLELLLRLEERRRDGVEALRGRVVGDHRAARDAAHLPYELRPALAVREHPHGDDGVEAPVGIRKLDHVADLERAAARVDEVRDAVAAARRAAAISLFKILKNPSFVSKVEPDFDAIR